MGMKESKAFWSRKRPRGQSIVEFALMLPILLILLSGLFEFGFLFTQYLAVLDSARNAARFSSDTSFDKDDSIHDCNATRDFYRQTACEAVIELANEQPTIELCLPNSPVSKNCDPTDPNKTDDVIISVFSMLRDPPGGITRFPSEAPVHGWSYAADLLGISQGGARSGTHDTNFTTAQVWAMRQGGTPNTGYVLVEINYQYHQILALPWFTQFVGDPIHVNLYAMWPCASAEPTPTSH
jgi:TadE-like protein